MNKTFCMVDWNDSGSRAFALYLCPHCQVFDSSSAPAYRNLPSIREKRQMPRGGWAQQELTDVLINYSCNSISTLMQFISYLFKLLFIAIQFRSRLFNLIFILIHSLYPVNSICLHSIQFLCSFNLIIIVVYSISF